LLVGKNHLKQMIGGGEMKFARNRRIKVGKSEKFRPGV